MTKPAGRIWFPRNPWPGGHALKDIWFWGALSNRDYRGVQKGVFLQLDIESVNYYDETPESELAAMHEAEERVYKQRKTIDDWRAIGAWSNYHRCHIRTNAPYELGTEARPFSLNDLDGFHWRPDQVNNPESNTDIFFDEQAFHCYILGHDAVACHSIKIVRASGAAHNVFDIDWDGRVALAYVGDYAYRHTFKVQMRNVPFVGFRCGHHTEIAKQLPKELRRKQVADTAWYNLTREKPLSVREAELREAASIFTKTPPDQLTFEAGDYADWLKF